MFSSRHVGREILLIRARQTEISRQHIPRAHVGSALDVGVPALRVDAAARHSDIAEHELQHRCSVNQLHGMTVLRPAQRVQDGPCRSGLLVEQITAAAFSNSAAVQPHIDATISGV